MLSSGRPGHRESNGPASIQRTPAASRRHLSSSSNRTIHVLASGHTGVGRRFGAGLSAKWASRNAERVSRRAVRLSENGKGSWRRPRHAGSSAGLDRAAGPIGRHGGSTRDKARLLERSWCLRTGCICHDIVGARLVLARVRAIHGLGSVGAGDHKGRPYETRLVGLRRNLGSYRESNAGRVPRRAWISRLRVAGLERARERPVSMRGVDRLRRVARRSADAIRAFGRAGTARCGPMPRRRARQPPRFVVRIVIGTEWPARRGGPGARSASGTAGEARPRPSGTSVRRIDRSTRD